MSETNKKRQFFKKDEDTVYCDICKEEYVRHPSHEKSSWNFLHAASYWAENHLKKCSYPKESEKES